MQETQIWNLSEIVQIKKYKTKQIIKFSNLIWYKLRCLDFDSPSTINFEIYTIYLSFDVEISLCSISPFLSI